MLKKSDVNLLLLFRLAGKLKFGLPTFFHHIILFKNVFIFKASDCILNEFQHISNTTLWFYLSVFLSVEITRLKWSKSAPSKKRNMARYTWTFSSLSWKVFADVNSPWRQDFNYAKQQRLCLVMMLFSHLKTENYYVLCLVKKEW